ncbi:MAG: PepSY-associated TM helix domain-containing protein [Ferruginibacter sp.]|nr:PepSY-associated TM helix domain-containing protein [Cytophagales bacterium]
MAKNQNPQLQLRSWHRDLGYFFFGLIISFAISGISQNHRRSWNPERYVYSSKEVQTQLHTLRKEAIDEKVINELARQHQITSPYRNFRLEDEGHKLRAFFADGILDVDLGTGKGKFEILRTRPLLGQMASLHKSTNSLWIWYSDIFALGMLTIAGTGLFMVKGKYGFRQRGYVLTLAGIVIPLLVLIFLI